MRLLCLRRVARSGSGTRQRRIHDSAWEAICFMTDTARWVARPEFVVTRGLQSYGDTSNGILSRLVRTGEESHLNLSVLPGRWGLATR